MRPRWWMLALTGMLAAHAALLVHAAWRNAPTCDEIGHLHSGIVQLQYGESSMYRVNPPLPRMLGALPALLLHPVVDIAAVRRTAEKPLARAEFTLADAFSRANADRLLPMLRLARLSGVAWSLAGALLVFAWSRRSYGLRAGLLGALLWCFCPMVLAHAPLLTPDVPATVAGLGAAAAFERASRRPNLVRWCTFGAVLGVALLTKFTLLLFVPSFIAVWIWRQARAQRRGARQAASLALAFGVALVVFDAGYGFRECPTRLGDVPFVSTALSGLPLERSAEQPAGNRFAASALGEVWLPVPRTALRGIDVQKRDFEVGILSCLRGTWRRRGWWYFYLYGLAIKLPPGDFALLGLAFIAARRSRAADPSLLTRAVLPAMVLLAVSANTGFTIHLRYVLPALPFAFIAAAPAAALLSAATARLGALVALAAASSTVQTLAIHPHELSYFNELAGGPEHGDEQLVDSNLDWGQDLLELRRWLDEHGGGAGLRLAYFGGVPPEAFGFEYTLPQRAPLRCAADVNAFPDLFGPTPGLYAISVNYLRGSRYHVPDGRWTREPVGAEDFTYFRTLRPIARAGYSILIYRLGRDDANAVRERLDLPLLD